MTQTSRTQLVTPAAQLLDDLARFLRGGATPSVLEPLLSISVPEVDRADPPDPIRSVVREAAIARSLPQIVLEAGFARYVENWALFPTMDATGQSLHVLRSLGSLEKWLGTHGEDVLRFLDACIVDRAVRVSPHAEAPSLFAALSACSVLKAFVATPQRVPFHEVERQLAEKVGTGLVARFRDAAAVLVRRCLTGDGLLQDQPAADGPSVHAIDFGVSVAWNLNISPESIGVDASKVIEFVGSCSRPCGDGRLGFAATPDSGLRRKPCSSTTALAYRAFRRASECSQQPKKWRFPFPEEQVVSFLLDMSEDGATRVFPGDPTTISATSFIADGVDELLKVTGQAKRWSEVVSKERTLQFVRACGSPSGGFAFAPGMHPNAVCTRYALRVLDFLREHDLRTDEVVPAATSAFVASLFDKDSGGFYGYPRPDDALKRRTQPTDRQSVGTESDLHWFYTHLSDFNDHAGQWAAVHRKRAIAFGEAAAVVAQARDLGIEDPILAYIPRADELAEGLEWLGRSS